MDEEEIIYQDLENTLKPMKDVSPCEEKIVDSEILQTKEENVKEAPPKIPNATQPDWSSKSAEFTVSDLAESGGIIDAEESIVQSFFITDISIDEESYILNSIQQTLNSTRQMYEDSEGNSLTSEING